MIYLKQLCEQTGIYPCGGAYRVVIKRLQRFPRVICLCFLEESVTILFPHHRNSERRTRQKLILLPKPNRSPGDPASYYLICLLDIMRKMMEKVIHNRLFYYHRGKRHWPVGAPVWVSGAHSTENALNPETGHQKQIQLRQLEPSYRRMTDICVP